MATYTFYWLDGKREVITNSGGNPAEVMTLHGYGNGAVRALDFYAEGDDNSYTWDSSPNNCGTNVKGWVKSQ